MDFRNLLSFRAEKQFEFGRAKLGVIADIFNLLNTNTVLFVQTLRYDLPQFLKPARIENPRTLRIGLRATF